jgi:hypothetical protein
MISRCGNPTSSQTLTLTLIFTNGPSCHHMACHNLSTYYYLIRLRKPYNEMLCHELCCHVDINGDDTCLTNINHKFLTFGP